VTLRVFTYLFFLWAWTYVDLLCLVVEVSPKILGDVKIAVLMHFGVKKNSNSTIMDLRGL